MRHRSWLVLLAALAGCYAVPATHPVPVEDAGAGVEDLDGDLIEEDASDPSDGGSDATARLDGSATDAKVDGSTCSCDGSAQICLPTGVCVECQKNTDCASGKLCLASVGQCVECLNDSACSGKPAASACDQSTNTCSPCTSNAQCDLVSGKNVCNAGACVECTQKDRASCKTDSAEQAVCDPKANTCTKRGLGTTPPCGDCVSDDECRSEGACVAVAAAGGAGKQVCQPLLRQGVMCPRPYMTASPMTTSADARPVQVCTLLSTTTCKAHNEYRDPAFPCGIQTAGGTDLPNSGDNSKCGVTALDDGYCVFAPASSRYLCTVPCTTAVDCPLDSTSCTDATHSTGIRRLCSFN